MKKLTKKEAQDYLDQFEKIKKRRTEIFENLLRINNFIYEKKHQILKRKIKEFTDEW